MNKSDQKRQAAFEEKFNNLFEDMIDKHRRVLPVRADIRLPADWEHDGMNTEICQFHKNIHQHYGSQGIDVRYHTVREQVSSENPHYHVMLLLDGDKVQCARKVQQRCEKIWNNIVNYEGTGLVDFCKPKPGYPNKPLEMVKRPSRKATGPKHMGQTRDFTAAKQIVHQHAEYLNKEAGKGKAPYRVREVFTSQIKKT